jgi:hypothetical protein
MPTIPDSNRFGKLTSKSLGVFCRNHKITLPDDYVNFLLEHNGGTPIPATNKLPETDVNYIFGIQDEASWASLEWYIQTFKERIPANYLPIAKDSGGNLFLMSLIPANYGAIFYWDHEYESESTGDSVYKNLRKSATSFSEFLLNLYEYTDPDETEQQRIIRTNDVMALQNLLDAGYGINTKDRYNRTLLENASMYNKFELVKMLIDRKAKKRKALELALQNMKVHPAKEYENTIALLRNYKDV